MKLKPVNDRALVKMLSGERKEGGIIIPDSRIDNRVVIEVLGNGEACSNYTVGDIVYLGRLSNKMQIGNLYLISISDIVMIEEKDAE